MITNIYTDAETEQMVIVIGLTKEDVETITVKNRVLRLGPSDEGKRMEGQADIILFSAEDDDALDAEMIKMFGSQGYDVPKKEKGT